MQTIIPISVEEASTDVLTKITRLITSKFNCTMHIDLYQGRGSNLTDTAPAPSPIATEVEEIFKLLGKSGQPHFIISLRPNSAP